MIRINVQVSSVMNWSLLVNRHPLPINGHNGLCKQKQYKTTTTGMRKVYVDFTGRHHQYLTVQGKADWGENPHLVKYTSIYY